MRGLRLVSRFVSLSCGLSVLVTVFLFSQFAAAQNATGTLIGEVQDGSGARVTSATVTATSNASGVSRQVSSGSAGEFRFPDLLPGSYHVVVDAKGFGKAETNVSVLVSNTRDVLVTVRPVAATATINVKGEASSITTQPLDSDRCGQRRRGHYRKTWKTFRWRLAVSPTSPIWCPGTNRSSLLTRPKRVSPRCPPAAAPA